MKPNLLTSIRALALADAKTRSQKYLKTLEEMGELAKVVLPLENAPGSMHNIFPRTKMLEECCDGILCLLSLAYADGFTDENIDDMMTAKTEKWAEKQEAEGQFGSTFPFEIHISVDPNCPIDEFYQACVLANVKPLVLKLDNGQGVMRHDVMTSSIFRGTNSEAMEEMERISKLMCWFNVTREKIETVPWHPKSPRDSQTNAIMPTNCYFEAHIGVALLNSDITKFTEYFHNLGMSVSMNARKAGPTRSIVMLTYRLRTGTRENFGKELDNIKLILDTEFSNVEIQGVDKEFAVWDTNPLYDDRK